jgi:lipopolysaccharide biosynthesis protein
MPTFFDSFRAWRRRLKAALPYVRRREFRVVQNNYAQLIDALDGAASPASSAALEVIKAIDPNLSGDVCLFVSFAHHHRIKPHVLRHVQALLDAQVSVVLIFNTDLDARSISIEPEFLSRLSGFVVRQNLGYDFGAWAHVLQLCAAASDSNFGRWSRLFLINDSIVGPLSSDAFDKLIVRIRESKADIVGLTEALSPIRHLQSYFLVFNRKALDHPAFMRLFARVLNWPSKSQVIDVYESRMAAQLAAHGLQSAAMFPSLFGDALSSDDTSLRWQELIRQGFPFVKGRVLQTLPAAMRASLIAQVDQKHKG